MNDMELRQLVRDTLEGVLRTSQAQLTERRIVSIRTDTDLAEFVTEILSLAQQPLQRARLQNKQLVFQLGDQSSAHETKAVEMHESQAPATLTNTTITIGEGAVTERMVKEAAVTRSSIVLGKRAVITPLAREQARKLKVEMRREA